MEINMLTLADINTVTNSKDGDIYSDLYKDVYGSRTRNQANQDCLLADATHFSVYVRN